MGNSTLLKTSLFSTGNIYRVIIFLGLTFGSTVWGYSQSILSNGSFETLQTGDNPCASCFIYNGYLVGWKNYYKTQPTLYNETFCAKSPGNYTTDFGGNYIGFYSERYIYQDNLTILPGTYTIKLHGLKTEAEVFGTGKLEVGFSNGGLFSTACSGSMETYLFPGTVVHTFDIAPSDTDINISSNNEYTVTVTINEPFTQFFIGMPKASFLKGSNSRVLDAPQSIVIDEVSVTPVYCSNNAAVTTIPTGTDLVVSNGIYNYGSHIHIKPGASLTFDNATVRMPAYGKIVVDRGARLNVINGSSISPYCEDKMWDGIEVWGNSTKPHPILSDVLTGVYPVLNNDHGVVYMDNATITKATMGVQAESSGNSNGYWYIYPDFIYSGSEVWGSHWGGVIVVNNSNFIDCKRQALIAQYPFYPPGYSGTQTAHLNISQFMDTKFTLSDYPASLTQEGISAWGTNNITVEGCQFRKLGIAITGINAPFNIYGNLFSSCATGIRVLGDNVTLSQDWKIGSSVKPNNFKNCQNGIYGENARNVVIDHNSFDGVYNHPIAGGNSTGVAFFGNSYMESLFNTFQSQTIGSLYSNIQSGFPNSDHCNTYTSHGIGIAALGNNTTLKFYRNDFNTLNGTDVYVANETKGMTSNGILPTNFINSSASMNLFSVAELAQHIVTPSALSGLTSHFYYYVLPSSNPAYNARIVPRCDLLSVCNPKNNFTNTLTNNIYSVSCSGIGGGSGGGKLPLTGEQATLLKGEMNLNPLTAKITDQEPDEETSLPKAALLSSINKSIYDIYVSEGLDAALAYIDTKYANVKELQRSRFSLLLDKGDINGALKALEILKPTLDETEYGLMKAMTGGDYDLVSLKEIASGYGTYRGLAATILWKKTGILPEPTIPVLDLDGKVSSQQNAENRFINDATDGLIKAWQNPQSIGIEVLSSVQNISLVSVLGNVLFSENYPSLQKYEINTSHFTNGIYYIVVTGKDGQKHQYAIARAN